MRFSVVGPAHPYRGGVVQHTVSLAEHLLALGHEVRLISWRSQYPKWLYPGAMAQAGDVLESTFSEVEDRLAWSSPASWWKAGREAAAWSDCVLFSVVNGFQVPAYVTMELLAQQAGATTVAVAHNVVPHDSSLLHQRVVSTFLGSVNIVVVHSRQEARHAHAAGLASVIESDLPFHPPAQFMDDDPIERDDDPIERVAGRGPTRLLFLGFVRPYKGVETLLGALGRSSSGAMCTIAGEFWTPREQLVQMASDLGIEGRVRFIEKYLSGAEMRRLLIEHDALVLPYLSATGSQQAHLAFSVGAPVVASDVGSFSVQIAHDSDGLLVPPGDEESLADAIDHLGEPGVLARLRSGVQPPDPDEEWRQYLLALEGAVRSVDSRSPPPPAWARIARTAASYVPSTSLLGVRRLKDLPARVRGVPHEEDLAILGRFSWKRPVVIDVGANRGQSIASFRAVLDDPQIVAIEPNPLLARALHERLGPGVRVVSSGLGSEASTVELHLPRYGHTVYDTRASLDRDEALAFLGPQEFWAFDGARAGLEHVSVPIQTLDALDVDPMLLKIDVEGVDGPVVEGGLETIRRSKPVIVIERPSPNAVDWLDGLGYVAARAAGSEGFMLRDMNGLNTFFLTDGHLRELTATGTRIQDE